MLMAAATVVFLMPVTVEARRGHRPRAKRREKRDGPTVRPAANRTRADAPLFRFAVYSDAHYWRPSKRRDEWMATSDARSARDGLLIADSPSVLQTALMHLSSFAAKGGSFAVHNGDSLCGGSSFEQTRSEYESNLQDVLAMQRMILGGWPVHHLPGNHDVDPLGGGLRAWGGVLGNSTPAWAGAPEPGTNYRMLRRDGWRLLLLDTMDGLSRDTDGHGHIGQTQLQWLQAQLRDSAEAAEQVVLVMHQLLAEPLGGDGALPRFLDRRQDFVDNRLEVLRVLKQHSHVRLSLHGHVHANTLTVQHGIVFASSASVGEFPMQWREVHVLPCEIRLRARPLGMPALLQKSARRETRGVNDGKEGRDIANVDLLFQGGAHCPKAEHRTAAAPVVRRVR